MARRLLFAAQLLASAAALVRLARGRARRPPPQLGAGPAPGVRVSVVIPARDEEPRIGPCLAGALADPDVDEVLVVVDDGTTDATAEVAARAGARVVAGAPLPEGWVGKPWVLQQGLEAARGEVVITLDADTRPVPGFARALVAELEGADIVTAATRFVCDTAGERLLHPAMLATLVYRFGPSGTEELCPPPARAVANGQVVAVRRDDLLGAGGFAIAREHPTDDTALARGLAAAGWRIRFTDGADLVQVRMHESAREVWREWGRSLSLHDVSPPAWLAADLAVVWLVMALPVLRAGARRATVLDRALLAIRFALLLGLRRAYARRGAPFWLSPLADPAVAVCLTLAVATPRRTWRGRTYGRPSRPIPVAGPPGSAAR